MPSKFDDIHSKESQLLSILSFRLMQLEKDPFFDPLNGFSEEEIRIAKNVFTAYYCYSHKKSTFNEAKEVWWKYFINKGKDGRYCRCSSGLSLFGKEKVYRLRKDWPTDCFCQSGNAGLVFCSNKSYETAFFEAFPKQPDTFIRGEGKTVREAEEKAWNKYQKIIACPAHEFERRDYRQGQGICKHCNLFMGKVFESLNRCKICGAEGYTYDKNNDWYCKEHRKLKPRELWTETDIMLSSVREEIEELEKESV